MSSDNHSRGLYSKYYVARNDTGNEAKTVIFCLDRKDPCALLALIEYAKQTPNQRLKDDLFAQVRHVLTDSILFSEIKWEYWSYGPNEMQMILDQAQLP